MSTIITPPYLSELEHRGGFTPSSNSLDLWNGIPAHSAVDTFIPTDTLDVHELFIDNTHLDQWPERPSNETGADYYSPEAYSASASDSDSRHTGFESGSGFSSPNDVMDSDYSHFSDAQVITSLLFAPAPLFQILTTKFKKKLIGVE